MERETRPSPARCRLPARRARISIPLPRRPPRCCLRRFPPYFLPAGAAPSVHAPARPRSSAMPSRRAPPHSRSGDARHARVEMCNGRATCGGAHRARPPIGRAVPLLGRVTEAGLNAAQGTPAMESGKDFARLEARAATPATGPRSRRACRDAPCRCSDTSRPPRT